MLGKILLVLGLFSHIPTEGKTVLTESVDSGIWVDSWDRKLDLSSQLAKLSSDVRFGNKGKGSADTVLVAFPPGIPSESVAFIEATVGTTRDKTHLRVMEAKVSTHPDVSFWSIRLKEPLKAGSTVDIHIEVVLAKSLSMFPAEIKQVENQLVLFEGLSHYAYSPYKVVSQTTEVQLPNSNFESYTRLKPVSHSDSVITYGPYHDVEPFSMNRMSLHYENNNPFMTIARLERILELSMWGNIAVTETLDIRHSGAKLKGSFSRYEYQRENSGVSSVKQFKTYLPASALDVYYRDDVGNISTSALRVLDDSVELELRPRFPLFGGWKTHYTIGYNVPSYEYLYSDSGFNFVLYMRLMDHVFNDMIVEDFVLKIILPEGVTLGKLHTPYDVKRGQDSLHYTYLDTTGRTLITLKNQGIMVEKHIQDFQLEFQYPKWTMIREAIMLICEFFFFFLLALIYVRLDFSISKDEGNETRMKVAGFCEILTGHQDKRAKCYTAFDDALVKLKSSKDLAWFTKTTVKLVTDHKVETSAITELNNTLKNIAPEVGEKVAELQKLDKLFRENQVNQHGLIVKLVTGKLPKQQFIDQEAVINKKKEECIEKINAIVRSL